MFVRHADSQRAPSSPFQLALDAFVHHPHRIAGYDKQLATELRELETVRVAEEQARTEVVLEQLDGARKR